MDILKQDMTYIWAVSGDITAPSNVKIEEGWAVEAVPRQWWNWMQNRADSNIAYMLQKGIPEWDATTEYLANKSFVNRSGIVYKAILTGTNQDPVSAPTYWVRAFQDYTAASNALGAVTPAANTMPYFTNGTTAATTSLTAFARTILDDADAAAVRTTISAQPLDATLTAVAGAATGANILHYFTGTDTVATTTLTAFGRSLIDDADATAGRATLGLSTGATATVTTSQTDATARRLLKVGDFGLGTSVPPSLTDLNDLTIKTGFYATNNTTANVPSEAAGAFGQLWHLNISDSAGSQLFLCRSGAAINTMYYRTATGGVWSAWEQTMSTSNLTSTGSSTTAGKIVKVGDYSLGAKGGTLSPVTITDDLNNAPCTGFFYTGTTVNNPQGSNGYLIHQESNSSTAASQVYIPVTSPQAIYFRRKASGTWTAWTQIFTTENVSAFAQTLLDDADATAARATLGLSTGATSTVTTSVTDTTSNRLLKVADFGVGATQLATGGLLFSDLNQTTLASGTYAYQGASTNAPNTFAGTFIQHRYSTTAVRQMALCQNGSGDEVRIYTRNWASATGWSAWAQLYTTAMLQTFMQNFLVTADAAAARTVLGLGTAATATLTTSTTDSTTGRVLRVGDFGLGTDTIPNTNGTNINTLLDTGVYTVSSPVNGPVAGSITVFVMGNDLSSGRTVQFAHAVNTEDHYVRSNSSGTWTAWKRQLLSTDVTTSTTDNTVGKLLKVGDFGVGTIVQLAAVDLNDDRGSGFYYCSSVTNRPIATNGWLLHERLSSVFATQTYTPIGSNRKFMRINNNGTWNAWQEIFQQGSILGTVSQSSGVPTGAIIERGSNANGAYVKFADGTLICTHVVAIPAWAAGNASLGTWTFPSAYAVAPVATVSLETLAPQTFNASVNTATTTTLQIYAGSTTTGASGSVKAIAIGRWF